MYSIKDYNNNNIELAKSLVIHLVDVAMSINKGLLINNKISTPLDKREWKYYMNLAGIKHSTNNDVKVTIIELGRKESLTLENLNLYPYTKSELLKQDTFYKNLVYDYPDDILYINGCLFPVDIDKAIESKDGEILNYNSTFIEENEHYLMKELQSHVYSFLKRWHVEEYIIIEELYLPSMLANLYSTLPAKIANLRLEKVYTNEVHSFHLEHFFRSNFNLYENITILKRNQIFWLYKNLNYLINNLGKNSALNLLIEKIITPNNLGLGEYIIRQTNKTLNSVQDAKLPSYVKNDFNLITQPLNSYYVESGIKNLETVVSKQLSLLTVEENNNKSQEAYTYNLIYDKLRNSETDNQKTKILDLTTYTLFKKTGVNIINLLLDFYIYQTQLGNIKFNIEYIEPNTNEVFNLTPKTIVLFLLKFLLYIIKEENIRLKEFRYTVLLNFNNDIIQEVKTKLLKDGYIEEVIDKITNAYSDINKNYSSTYELNISLNNLSNLLDYIWTLDANSENAILSGNIKTFLNLIRNNDSYILSETEEGETIDELLLKNNIKFDIKNTYNIYLSLQTLIKNISNINIDENELINNITVAFRSFIDKLTSYTTHTLTTTTENIITLRAYYNNLNLLKTNYGIININKASMRVKEEDYINISVVSNNNEDNIIVYSYNSLNVRTYDLTKGNIQHKTYLHIPANVDEAIVAPTFSIEEMKE